MTFSAFFMILFRLSLSCIEMFRPQQTQPKVSTLENDEVKTFVKFEDLYQMIFIALNSITKCMRFDNGVGIFSPA